MKRPIHPMSRRLPKSPIRLLTAVPICDGHDSAINAINLELIRHGIEVVYLGYHRSAQDIVRAATQEDVRAIGISSYNGGHVEFFDEVIQLLKKAHAPNIRVFGGGGGTITQEDAERMHKRGVDRIFFPGTSLAEIAEFVREHYAASHHESGSNGRITSDRQLGQMLTRIEAGQTVAKRQAGRWGYVVGVTGPGGAGKTTLIDELVRRFLIAHPRARIAILSHDPSIVGAGALLGDRATMIYSQDDRVFMRSFATRGRAGGLSPSSERCVRSIQSHFDLVFIETVGTGQEAIPFRKGLVDMSILVMSPDYGARLQLQKIAMLDAADVIVVNKSDLPKAATASSEIEQRLATHQRNQQVIATVAKRHEDRGVDQLFELLQNAKQ